MTEHNWISQGRYEHYKCSICNIIKNKVNELDIKSNLSYYYGNNYSSYLGIREPSCNEIVIRNVLL